MKIIKVENCLGCPYSQGYYSWRKSAMIRICELLGQIIKTPLDSIPEDCPLGNAKEEPEYAEEPKQQRD